MTIDLRSVLGLDKKPEAPKEDPAAIARRELEALRAERARRQAIVAAVPAKAPLVDHVNARLERDRVEIAEIALADSDPEGVIAEKCRRSLAYYVRRQWTMCTLTSSTPLEWGPHLDAICSHIQGQLEDSAAKRENPLHVLRAQNLLINCPPRSLKTIILTFANAWAWIRWPWMQILYMSATPSVVLDSARLFRDAVSSTWYQRLFVLGKWKLRDDQDALSSMGNTAGGARRAKGFEAKVLGTNADWLCIDDAHAMDDTPESMAQANEHYDGNVSSRMNDPRTGIRTAIMQRAARGDFSDHVLLQGWFHLRMPMEYEGKPECSCPQCQIGSRGEKNAFGWVDWRWTPDGSREGEIMHERFTREYLAERLLVLRPHGYAGQMQQRPSPKEGNQFKVGFWRYAKIEGEELPYGRPFGANEGPPLVLKRLPASDALFPEAIGRLDVEWVCLSVDATGGSTSETASALGLVAGCARAERRVILADYTAGPKSWGQTLPAIKAALAALATLTGWHTKIRVLVEKKALGEAAMGQLKDALADGTIKDRWGRTVIAVVEPYEPTGKGDKEQRAEVMEPMLEGGLMFLLEGADWTVRANPGAGQSYVDEFAAFPKAPRDDRVDATSQMIDRYRKRSSDWTKLFGGSRQ